MSSARVAIALVSEFNFASMKAKDIAISLMTRALDRGDEDRMMDRISFHFNRAHDMPDSHKVMLAWAREWDRTEEPRAVRALNMVADIKRQELQAEGKEVPEALNTVYTGVENAEEKQIAKAADAIRARLDAKAAPTVH